MKTPDKIKEISKNLRNNMTESELIIWSRIKNSKLWIKFLRQKPINIFNENNWFKRYIIPDFYCHDKKLILEIDWNIHNLKEIYLLDKHKELLLKNQWFTIIRIRNKEIKNNLNSVILKLKKNT